MRTIAGWLGGLAKWIEHRLDEPNGGYRRVPENGAPKWLRRLRGALYSFSNGPIFTDP